jgi:hypothetical protein
MIKKKKEKKWTTSIKKIANKDKKVGKMKENA